MTNRIGNLQVPVVYITMQASSANRRGGEREASKLKLKSAQHERSRGR